MLEGRVKKHLFPFPAESEEAKYKGAYRHGAFKPIEHNTSPMGALMRAPDRKHPMVFVELFGVIVSSLSAIFERSWQLGEVHDDWKNLSLEIIKTQAFGLDDLQKSLPMCVILWFYVPVQMCAYGSLTVLKITLQRTSDSSPEWKTFHRQTKLNGSTVNHKNTSINATSK